MTEPHAVLDAAGGTDVIIHLAAYTHVDRCEIEPGLAWKVNAEGTRNVAQAARAGDARVIYVSTDYVFDGDKEGEYSENDLVAPLNVYGTSKLGGERALDTDRDLIVRSSWIFGDGRNFVSTILAAARTGPLRVVGDQRGRPTAASALAEALVSLLASETTGVIHVAGDGDPCTWADLAQAALDAAGAQVPIDRIDTETYVRDADRVIAPRPRNSALALDRARSLEVPLLDWQASVEAYVRGRA